MAKRRKPQTEGVERSSYVEPSGPGGGFVVKNFDERKTTPADSERIMRIARGEPKAKPVEPPKDV